MKHQDDMDKARDWYVDAIIDQAAENDRRTLHQKGRLLKEKVGKHYAKFCPECDSYRPKRTNSSCFDSYEIPE